MRILIINPNSSPTMTQAIDHIAKDFAGDRFEVVTLATPGASPFVATFEDYARSMPGMVQLLKDNYDKFDGFVIACHSDPNLELMKELSYKPVVGICESSLKIASMLGDKFSVVSPGKRSVPNKIDIVCNRYRMAGYLASVRAPEKPAMEGTDMKALLLPVAKKAVEEDGAEVIVLGCAGFAGLDKALEAELHVPVLDGTVCALMILEGLIRYHVGISKRCRFKPNE
jgi:allantoin racemase